MAHLSTAAPSLMVLFFINIPRSTASERKWQQNKGRAATREVEESCIMSSQEDAYGSLVSGKLNLKCGIKKKKSKKRKRKEEAKAMEAVSSCSKTPAFLTQI